MFSQGKAMRRITDLFPELSLCCPAPFTQCESITREQSGTCVLIPHTPMFTTRVGMREEK